MAVKQIKKTKKQKQLPVPKVESVTQKSFKSISPDEEVETLIVKKSQTVHNAAQKNNPSNIIVIDGITHY